MSSKRFLQTEFWATFKSRHGWKSFFFSLDETGDVSLVSSFKGLESEKCLSVLVRNFKNLFSIAYIPMAPEIQFSSNSTKEEKIETLNKKLSFIFEKITPFLPKNTICIRFDPAVDFEKSEDRDDFVYNIRHSHLSFIKKRVRKPKSDIQPPDTVLLSLSKSEEELISSMKSKWRYNIRLSLKKGVEVHSFDAKSERFNQAFEDFYKLFIQTGERDGVQFHQKEYYLDLLLSGKENDDKNIEEDFPVIKLYLALHEKDILAGIIVLFSKKEAVYLYGASGNIKRNLMPSYLLQWTAICDAKKSGCPVYDFYGCPPSDDEKHPMHGLYLFKTGFGGTLIHRPGSIDVIKKSRKTIYNLYQLAESMRAWWFKILKKKLIGR